MASVNLIPDYTVGPGDTLEINVWDNPAFSVSVPVLYPARRKNRGYDNHRSEFRPNSARMVDFIAPFTASNFKDGIQLAINKAKEIGCDTLEVSSTPDLYMNRALDELGFIVRDKKEPWMFQVMLSADRLATELLINQNSWYVLSGDRDRHPIASRNSMTKHQNC